MEHESFENPEIAVLMNQWFVCIKVDREERPDLDQIYMNAVQAMTGSGGWPMSMFLTPSLKPFYGGTYWPPTARWGRPGFREILTGVHDAWVNRRDAVDSQADEITQHLQHLSAPSVPPSALGDQTLHRAMSALITNADRVHGGFGSAPKFPHPMDLRLGMRCWKRFHNVADQKQSSEDMLDVVTLTLDKMARGGIYDHLGGGFARYSTDERWLVPHFEKMLYDNAQLVPAYLEAFQITGRHEFAQVARETLDYVLREMTQPDGAFYSTQDADSEGVEGRFFVWSESEIDSVLAPEAFHPLSGATESAKPPATDSRLLRAFKHCYDVTAHGNWEHSNILNRLQTNEQAAKALLIDPIELESLLAQGRKKLFEVRSKRVWPGRDEKILTSWNGLMIAAMSMAANVLQEPRYAQAARAAADFILSDVVLHPNRETESTVEAVHSNLKPRSAWTPIRLLHCYKDGRARFNAYLDDYAAMIDGLCELYQAVFDVQYLDAALKLAERMLDQFWDESTGGFFYTSNDHETLIARVKDVHDNATPSSNSLAVMGLLKLARLTGRPDLEEKAVTTLEMMSGQLERVPLASGMSLMALDFVLGPTHEIVVAHGGNADEEIRLQRFASDDRFAEAEAIAGRLGISVSEALVRLGYAPESGREKKDAATLFDRIRTRLHQRFLPNKVIHWRAAEVSDDDLPPATREVLKGKNFQRGEITAFVCQHGVCGAPVVGEQAIEKMLENLE